MNKNELLREVKNRCIIGTFVHTKPEVTTTEEETTDVSSISYLYCDDDKELFKNEIKDAIGRYTARPDDEYNAHQGKERVSVDELLDLMNEVKSEIMAEPKYMSDIQEIRVHTVMEKSDMDSHLDIRGWIDGTGIDKSWTMYKD